MNREHENDISIGKDQWIIFEDPKDDREYAVNIDPLMAVSYTHLTLPTNREV